MSLMKRMLASVGIGAAKVDTIVQGDRFAPGDTLDAVVKVMGGKTEQQIDSLYFSVCCNYEATRETEDDEGDETEVTVTETAVLEKFKVSEAFAIGPGDTEEIPLSFQLPFQTPLTLGKTKVWIATGLDIKKAIDPGDTDYIEVVPGDLTGALFDALNELGFELVKAKCEAVGSGFHIKQPFVQEFEFKPVSGNFRSKLDELELICFPQADNADVIMEIDRKARGLRGFFAEMTDMDETRIKFSFNFEDLPHLSEQLLEMIEHWSE